MDWIITELEDDKYYFFHGMRKCNMEDKWSYITTCKTGREMQTWIILNLYGHYLDGCYLHEITSDEYTARPRKLLEKYAPYDIKQKYKQLGYKV